MPQWTEQQKKAIETRGQNLLVSAAAGSGKTAVLSARVGEFVEQGGRLDRLLVVTFTKLAAAEMRSRIARELNNRTAAHPEDLHLRRQSLTLYKAKISTIDSFGIDILRRNFQKAGLSPDFTVLDEGELTVMKSAVLQQLLEEYYQDFPEGFSDLLSLFGGDTDSKKTEEVILQVADEMEYIPFPNRWTQRQLALLQAPEQAVREVCRLLLPMAEEYREILAQVHAASPYGEKGNESVASDHDFFCRLCDLLKEERWEEVCAAVGSNPLSRAASAKGEKTREMALYSEYRSESNSSQSARALYPEFLKSELFRLSEQTLRTDLQALTPGLTFLFRAVEEFRQRLMQEMHRRSAYSFATLSEMALSLVVEDYSHETGQFTPSAVALAERSLYDEVLIDEYQDVNDLQDLFFRAITKDNCFAVGDVKQSIYGFRGANPANFLRKKTDSTVIALNKNFRSRKGVLDYVNFLFRGLFSQEIGGMEYDENEALFPGRGEDAAVAYPPAYATTLPSAGDFCPVPREKDPEPDTELLLIPTPTPKNRTPEEGDLAQGEALLCAKLIGDALQGGATVYDKGEETHRPMRPSDIAILLRTSKSVPIYEEVFRNAGIPLLAADGGTFLDTPEVGGVLAFLQTVNDPRDDLALFVTLTGSIFAFSPEKVSLLRDPSVHRCLWDSLCLAAEGDEDCAQVLHTVEKFRILAENIPIPRLIWEIYTATDYLALESASDKNARTNLMKFYSFACRYRRADGLFGFLEYADRARRAENVKEAGASPEGDFVRIMTIHKSKGLEFAWCILPEMNRDFASDREQVRVDRQFGVAPRVRNEKQTASYTTLVRELIKLKSDRTETAERLRVLYVALTRARDRLTILSRCPEDLTKTDGHGLHTAKGKVRLVTLLGDNNFRKILFDRTVLHPKATVLHSAWEAPEPTTTEDLRVSFVGIPAPITATATEEAVFCGLSEEELQRRFSFRYDTHLSTVPAKVSVTEISKSPADPHTALLIEQPPVSRPKFLDDTPLTGAEAGTALHTYCQFADLNKPVKEQVTRLTKEGHLSDLAAKAVDEDMISAFLQSELMEFLRQSQGYEREVRFVCRIPVSYYSGNPGDEGELLMQGAIDLLCETEDGYLIVDFKSDRATEEELLARYARQLNLYAAAVRRLYDKPVIGCKIWSFRLKKALDVPEELL
ncbi:MAG: UvrD-helicase domain-containing protein [Clostridia bacterium]|nr:UvrD-helicase domain-containing protein [Clostridia bacterium]